MFLINSNSTKKKQKQKIKPVLCHVGVIDDGASRNGEGKDRVWVRVEREMSGK